MPNLKIKVLTSVKATRFLPVLCLVAVMLMISFTALAGENPDYARSKERLLKVLKEKYIDKAYIQTIERFYNNTSDSLIKKKFTVDNRPIKEILAKLFDITYNRINANAITSLAIPTLNYNFLVTVKTYKKESVNPLFMRMNVIHSKILQSVFDGLILGDSIRTFVGLREMYYEPYFISSNISLPQYATYKDTLLYLLANGAPEILIRKLTDKDTLYTSLVNKNNKITVKAVSLTAMDDYYEKTIPFSLAILENRITADSIKKLTLVPQEYYHAFVEEAIRLHTNPDPEINTFLKHPITELNKKFANYYFIKEINDLHESPDNTRFKVVQTLSARALYFLLLPGSYELVMEGSSAIYTSSFFYVYKKFIKETSTEGLNKFFDDIGYYQFDQFISNISDYGLVDDLVNNLEAEKVAELLGKYLFNLPNKQLSENEINLNAMTMAEILYQIRHHKNIMAGLIGQLEKMESQPRIKNHFMYRRMYSGLKDIMQDKVKYESDITYDVLKVKRMQSNNTVVQACFFYDDDDAVSSFNSSTASYDDKTWDKKDLGNYIVFNSRTGNNMKVYMNKPKTVPGCDSAQNEMLLAIEQAGFQVTSFIHRGHSYHLSQSLKKMTASSQFVFLGSCGGYNQVLKIFQLNPDVNIITTRSVGSKMINDPLLIKINNDIVNNKDIVWNDLWQEFNAKFQSKSTKDLFAAYIPPNNYIGIKFIRKVFNY